MMMDEDIVAVSPSSVYRVLKRAGLLDLWNRAPSKKGAGLEQPLKPHEDWHTDISYINPAPAGRHILLPVQRLGRLQPVHRLRLWRVSREKPLHRKAAPREIRESMREADVEIVLTTRAGTIPRRAPCYEGSKGR